MLTTAWRALGIKSDEPTDRYLELDEFTNALDYLRKGSYFLQQMSDPYRWKWAAICLSNALYGFMIAALTGSNFVNVLDQNRMSAEQKDGLKHLAGDSSAEAHVKRQKIIDEFAWSKRAKLISFHEALKRIQKGQHKTLVISRAVEISEQQKQNVLELRRYFRDQFEHYRPVSWAIEQRCMIPLFRDSTTVTDQVVRCNSFFRADGIEEAVELCSGITRLLDRNDALLQERDSEGTP